MELQVEFAGKEANHNGKPEKKSINAQAHGKEPAFDHEKRPKNNGDAGTDPDDLSEALVNGVGVIHEQAPLSRIRTVRSQPTKKSRCDESAHARGNYDGDQAKGVDDQREKRDSVWRIDFSGQCSCAEKGKGQPGNGEDMHTNDDGDEHIELGLCDVKFVAAAAAGMKCQDDDISDCSDD